MLCLVMFILYMYIPVINFTVKTSTKQRIKCVAEGHNTLSLVSLDLATLRPEVYHSTTESLRSSQFDARFGLSIIHCNLSRVLNTSINFIMLYVFLL